MKLRELGREELRHRLRSTFFDGYMTLIGIVQGAVFSMGAHQTLSTLTPGRDDYTFLIWAFTSFLYVVTVYYYYYWFVLCFGAFPTFGEFFRPFMLGAIEFAAVYNITNTRRFLFVSMIFFSMASGIFLSALRFNRPSLYKSDAVEIYQLLRIESIKNMIGTLLLALVCGGSYVLIARDDFSFPYFEVLIFSIMFVIAFAQVCVSELYFRVGLFAVARKD
jgi:hypothetical protein